MKRILISLALMLAVSQARAQDRTPQVARVMDGMDRRMDSIENQILQKLEAIQHDVRELKAGIAANRQDLANLDRRVSALESKGRSGTSTANYTPPRPSSTPSSETLKTTYPSSRPRNRDTDYEPSYPLARGTGPTGGPCYDPTSLPPPPGFIHIGDGTMVSLPHMNALGRRIVLIPAW